MPHACHNAAIQGVSHGARPLISWVEEAVAAEVEEAVAAWAAAATRG
jgi:hypothetical protein